MKKYTFVIILFVFLESCDSGYKNCTEHHYSDNFKSNVMFNIGSYWVYKDTIFNIIDSAYLKSQDFSFIEDCDYHGEPTDVLNQTFSYSRNNTTNDFQVFCLARDNVYATWDFLGYYTDNCAVDPLNSCSSLDSMTVNGINYYNISVFNRENKRYYWSKNIGIIRKEFPKSQDNDTIYHFDLLRYHIN
ncbi:MAG: hypothetical protein WCQ95_00610 [Bacteroidota bacterium]